LIRQQRAILQFEPYTSNVVLTDGGVYDNLGLETAWKNYETIWSAMAAAFPTTSQSQNETGLNTLIGF